MLKANCVKCSKEDCLFCWKLYFFGHCLLLTSWLFTEKIVNSLQYVTGVWQCVFRRNRPATKPEEELCVIHWWFAFTALHEEVQRSCQEQWLTLCLSPKENKSAGEAPPKYSRVPEEAACLPPQDSREPEEAACLPTEDSRDARRGCASTPGRQPRSGRGCRSTGGG